VIQVFWVPRPTVSPAAVFVLFCHLAVQTADLPLDGHFPLGICAVSHWPSEAHFVFALPRVQPIGIVNLETSE